VRLFYLSFADPEKPKGQQFLGATIVEAGTEVLAVAEAWLRGINPGGEVAIVDLHLSPDDLPSECASYLNRLVPREEIFAQPHELIFGDDE
jgi:hypothetical protein